MRLSHKVFVTTALLMLALAGVGTWSLLAISRLVDVNRAIATQSVPALRMATSLREQLTGLARTDESASSGAAEGAQRILDFLESEGQIVWLDEATGYVWLDDVPGYTA